MTKKDIKGYVLIGLAAVCFMIGNYFQGSGDYHHKILVATEKMQDGVFDKTVILVINDNRGTGTVGFILNKPGTGGPVNPDITHAIFTPHPDLQGGRVYKDLGLVHVQGTDERTIANKPEWKLVVNGAAGWNPGQLDDEVSADRWEVIPYDKDLVMKTPPEDLWNAAMHRARKGPAG